MTSKSSFSYEERAKTHASPLAKRLFVIASNKKTNLTLSADVTTTKELLNLADSLGPYIAVLKTHIDIISDFSNETIAGLQELSQKHNFLLFEDRKFVDIGNTVQKQYHGGVLRIAEWAHIVNAAILAGPGIIEALGQSIEKGDFGGPAVRAILILAEMTSKGSLAVGEYTRVSVETAQRHPRVVMGLVATLELSAVKSGLESAKDEDFVVFTTGVNIASKGDALGQQYQTPESAIKGGGDFIIAGRGIYAAPDPIAAVKSYREKGWSAYLSRIGAAPST